MCGIVGILCHSGPVDPGRLIRMRDRLTHRGPDDAGVYHSPDGHLALGNRRLAILDPHPQGHQPLCNEDQTVWITYNGEIYNFHDLHADLEQSGHIFQSKTDTEVLIHGYEAWGLEGLLARLKGMFAFALYDLREDPVLFIARDRLGIKPLYYTQVADRDELVFASEVQALLHDNPALRGRDTEALIGLLLFGSIPGPSTIYTQIRCLPPGHFMTLENQQMVITKYWAMPASGHADMADESHETVIDRLRTQLGKTVEQHLISDVPTGVFLSGGIDSGALVALASRNGETSPTTLTIAFSEQTFNEADEAQQLARRFQTDHHAFRITDQDFVQALPDILSGMDLPTNDGVNTYFVSQAARRLGLKVVLSGVGGDELFLGYTHHRRLYESEKWWAMLYRRSRPVRSCLARLAVAYGYLRGQEKWRRFGFLSELGPAGVYLLARGFFAPDQIQKLLHITQSELDGAVYRYMHEVHAAASDESDREVVAAVNQVEMQRYLPDQLLRDTDIFSMAHSVEVRVPFLDHELVETAMQASTALKMKGGLKKSLLVQALDLPEFHEIARRPKRGFSFPMAGWMRLHADMLEGMIAEPEGLDRQVFQGLWRDFRAIDYTGREPGFFLFSARRNGNGRLFFMP